MEELNETLNYTSNDTASIENYNLTLLLSYDGKHYSTALTPTQGCGASMFSSDAGVIYNAVAFGCK